MSIRRKLGGLGLAPAIALTLAFTALPCMPHAHAAAAERPGGQIALPPGAEAFELAEQVRIGAHPTRIRLFRVAQPLHAVQAHFRTALGAERIETEHEDWTVLARLDASRLTGVRLRAIDSQHTEGSVAITVLKASALETTGANPLEVALPTASRLSGDVAITEHGRSARSLVWHNRHSTSLNVRHLLRQLKHRGYTLEREIAVAGGRGLWFAGDARDALAVVTARGGESVVVLQLVHGHREAR